MRTYLITGFGNEDSLGFMIAEAIVKYDPTANIIAITKPDVVIESDLASEVFYMDLSENSEFRVMTTAIKEIAPTIDVMINCAGMNSMDWIEDMEYFNYQKVMNVNLNAPIFLVKGLLQSLQNGVVLNIISMGAHKPFRTSLPYNVSKAGLSMANKQMARELGSKFGITVFGISPNQLKGTGMTKENADEICRIRGWTPEQAEEYRRASAMNTEETDPETLADFIAYLVHDDKNCKHLGGVELQYGD